jgi:hypothetical protein
VNDAVANPVGEPLPSFTGNRGLDVLVIFAGLVLFAFVMEVRRRRREAWAAARAKATGGSTVEAAAAGGLSPELVAVISAAVSALLSPEEHITAIQETPEGAAPGIALQQWSLEGRRQVFSSHQFRGGKR